MHPDSKIIDAIGGTNAVAELCHVSAPSVSAWRHNGIPPARRMYLEQVRPDVVPPDPTRKISCPSS